ncbi:hypothetical protein M8C21_002629 [Ambrosia artemisiifolia]|uniref:Rapid ALkalinization Factor n=1 Tax=Ambrosia artemisiifolia TaxID=4212 RepID=A0AAD5GQT3_AMBAR|nr:hypothetical protein M8C21_002629 [Ambrosia artemisiifolia]
MPISNNIILLLHLLITVFMLSTVIMSPSAASNGGEDQFSWNMSKQGGCRGSIAECMADGEIEMESERTRRILATSNYISYDALQGNNVPCSQRGASYYNCQSGGQANPYQRGCSTITRCRR